MWVSEHGLIKRGLNNRVLADGHLQVTEDDFASLVTLLDERDLSGDSGSPIFAFCRVAGTDCLKVQNWVGVVRTSTGTQIEILPKLAKVFDRDTSRELLVKMLIELGESPFKEGTVANLDAHKMPLFELLLRYFLDQVTAIVRKGLARTYVPHSDNLVFLRGKLQITEHLKHNLVRSERMYCSYDEYEANRPINRLIRGALDITSKLTRDGSNQQLCRELLYCFGEVPPSQMPELDFRRVQQDRLIHHYKPAMPLCRMILLHLNPLTKEGERKAISMLFPMERVFEDYVEAKLPRQFPSWIVRGQVGGHALVEQHADKVMFRLRPDLELRKRGSVQKVVADTKWKLIDQSARAKNYKISQADIYQLFGYLKKHLSQQTEREVYLIYPRSDSFSEPLAEFCYSDPLEKLWVVPYDLEKDLLLLPPECMLADIELADAI